MKNLCELVISAPDTGSQTSKFVDTNQLIAVSFLGYFGDTSAAGTLKIQASNDPNPSGYLASIDGFAPTNWADIPSATATVTAGASVLITLPQIVYRWLRVVYTSSGAGTTTISVAMNAITI